LSSRESAGSERPDNAGVAFHPPVVPALSLALGFLGRWIVPLTFLPGDAPEILGPFVVTVPLGLFGWAVYTMHAGHTSVRTSDPTDTIVVNGPFRFSRNPIYLSMVLVVCGVGVWANSLWFLGWAGVSAALLWWGVISREERYLERKFGPQYSAYKKRVRRWL
jgi:protein-S-isoprenylcysteine O-methyltransferase Ste14